MTKITIIGLVLLFSCSTREKTPLEETDTTEVTNEGFSTIQSDIKATILKDTTINGVTLEFESLTKPKYDSLLRHEIIREIPLTSFNHLVTQADSCQIIKLYNKKVDSLCNFVDENNEYFERFYTRGFWKEKNQLLVSFENWEEYHDYMINLNNGNYYIFNPNYTLSPNQDFILSYTDISATPIYSNDFMLTSVTAESAVALFNIDFGMLTITNAAWLSDTACLISAGELDGDNFTLKQKSYYLMKIIIP